MFDDHVVEEVVTVKTEDFYAPLLNGFQQEAPHLTITEQPAASVRFRYPSEGNSHGGIPGVQSKEFRKTCPTVEIVGYKGHARIVVQLVTDDQVPKLHVHSLVGKQCNNGICSVTCGPGEMRSQFPNLGIQHVKRKDAEQIISCRLAEQYPRQMTDKDRKEQAKSDVERMNLSTVRLMFIAYLPDENNELTQMLSPVYSTVIMDNKSTLKICRISRVDSPATGGTEVYLLCDKVQKDDIQVRMFEVDASQNEVWEDYCRFSPTDVHRQYAIVMKTPAYRIKNIDRPAKVYIQLRRKSDGQFSQPQQFTYTPVYDENDLQPTKRKRANCVVGNANMSHMSALGGVTNTYRAPMKRNVKPKVDHHVKPIDPSVLMKQFTQAPAKTQSPPQRSPTYVPMQTTMQGTNVSQSMVMASSAQQYQNYQPMMSNAVVTTASTISDMSALSPQNLGSPMEDVLSVSSHGHGSPFSNPGSVGMSDNSQGSPLQVSQMHSPLQQSQMSPLQQSQMSPVQQVLSPASTQQATVTVSSYSNVPTSLPCIPGMNIPKPAALQSSLQQNQISQAQRVYSQGSSIGQIYAPMQNVQANSSPSYGLVTYTQQETDRQAFGDDYESVLDQLDADNENGRVPSLGSQFVETLLTSGGFHQSFLPVDRGIPLIQADCTVETTEEGDERSEDFTCAMQESCEEENDHSYTTPGEVFAGELLHTVSRNIARSLIDYRKTKNPEILASVEQLFNKVHDRGNTCLHLAALNSQSGLLIKLVKLSRMVKEDGSLLNVCNASQQTPLHLAILCKDISAVKSLIAAGADPKIVDGNGNTGIHLACSIGHPEMLNTILTVVDCCDGLYNYEGLTPLHTLIDDESETSCECLQALLTHNLDVNERELKSGLTALHMAIENSNVMIAAHLLVECGADIDATTFSGLTPLHIAAAQGELDLVKMLLALGADKDSEDFDCPVLSIAANDEIRGLLNRYSADPAIVREKFQILFESGHSSFKKDILDILDIDGRTDDLGVQMGKLTMAAPTEVY